LFCFVLVILFYRLGGPALFEPDEGRNAEKAREILVLNNWITPHENFHAVLDKPIFFYWLIALAYKLFGVSEWAARLPSALAAFGCIVMAYFFVRSWWGEWEARWSVLSLVTSSGFFVFSRIVIFDLPLTAFITLALCAFYQAAQTPRPSAGWGPCILLYGSLGAATLTKGLVGILVPGMIMFLYLLLTRGWRRLTKIRLLPGVLLFLLIVTPWYVLAETNNPGYLRYYLWDEHFGRFATTQFDRFNPWYFYLYVVPVGLLPWTCLLPITLQHHWRHIRDDKTIWLILWAVMPIVFFSFSKAKLPHYILPSFPPLAILIGVALSRILSDSPERLRYGFAASWVILSTLFIYLIAGLLRPELFPRIIRGTLDSLAPLYWVCALVSVALALLAFKHSTWTTISPWRIYFAQGFGLLLFVIALCEMMVLIAPARSARDIAAKAQPYISPTTQVVSYDTYLEGLPFYLKTEKPVWMVTHRNKKKTFLGNFYMITKQPEPLTRWGKALLDFDEFTEKWQTVDQPLLVLVKEKNLRGLEKRVGTVTKRLAVDDEYLLITRP
jgi:4-amino-4-deoxy-L-arabinose transferase-like glycosyltransferase